MANKLVKALLSPVYRKIARYIRHDIPHNPSITGKFMAYDEGATSFIIERAGSGEAEIAEPGLPAPIKEKNLRHTPNGLQSYLNGGKRDFEMMMKILGEVGYQVEPGHVILDFGCSTARILRWFKEDSAKAEFWGVDIHAGDIAWCKINLSPPFKFATTTMQPHLPFEDNTFDMIYAGSLFTHIDDQADSWFLELRRVLKPEGLAYVTIHDEHTIEIFEGRLKDSPTGQVLAADEAYQRFIKQPYAMFTVGRSIWSQVFYNREWLKRHLGDIFEIASITEEAYGTFQTAFVLRKKPRSG
jgi:ubiquinone/menaquinone biosynthesis C-methylase UbiE